MDTAVTDFTALVSALTSTEPIVLKHNNTAEQKSTARNHEMGMPTNPHRVPDSQSNDGANDNANNANARLRLQRVLNKILSNRDKEELKAKLFSIGYEGHLMTAQLNSQLARSAMAWLGLKGLSLPNLQMALITLTAVGASPIRVHSNICPWCKSDTTIPNTPHMMCCPAQNEYGSNDVHTHQKRELQKLCRTTGRILGPVGNEDTSVFKAPTPRTS